MDPRVLKLNSRLMLVSSAKEEVVLSANANN